MIPLNELRIDSLLLYKGKPVQVDSIDKGSISVVPAGNPDANPELVMIGSIGLIPLRLTPELMVKIGYLPFDWAQFKGLMEHYTDPEKKLYLRFHENGVSVFTEGMVPELYNYITQINYFHQLQNVFFDLFGIEIAIPSS